MTSDQKNRENLVIHFKSEHITQLKQGKKGETKKEREKERRQYTPLFFNSRELLWDNVLQKIEAKEENLRERERTWFNESSKHSLFTGHSCEETNRRLNLI